MMSQRSVYEDATYEVGYSWMPGAESGREGGERNDVTLTAPNTPPAPRGRPGSSGTA